MTNVYDIAIVGAGCAGAFAISKILSDNKDAKIVFFDQGRPFLKRRLQVSGYLGLLPNADGKLYLNELKTLKNILGDNRANNAFDWLKDKTKNQFNFKIIKDTKPYVSIQKKLKANKFSLSTNNHIQILPTNIHALTKKLSNEIINAKNITQYFDTEIVLINKVKSLFEITTYDDKVFYSKKVLITAGRSGWRWTRSIFSDLGVKVENDFGKFGIKAEMPDVYMQEFNKSNCSIFHNDFEIGPFCWNGTVIPEDHCDTVIASFRSNEDRWKTNKVNFDILCETNFDGYATEQIDRMGQLTWILANDRVVKEKISLLLTKKSRISIMGEYDWLIEAIKKMSVFIPNFIEQGSFHIPTIIPCAAKPKINKKLETNIKGLYCAGESAGYTGLLFAMLSGIIAGENIVKGI